MNEPVHKLKILQVNTADQGGGAESSAWHLFREYKNTAIYLLFVGSRHPERWKGLLPAYCPIKEAGSWIGDNLRALGGPLCANIEG